MNYYRIFACEPFPFALEGLSRVLAETPDLRWAGGATHWDACRNQVEVMQPDLVLLGQSSSFRVALERVGILQQVAPGAGVVLWTPGLEPGEALRALQVGVRGIICKESSVGSVLDGLRAAAKGAVWVDRALSAPALGTEAPGEVPLTPREKEVVRYVSAGLSNRAVGAALAITPGTVKVHLMHIFEKTGVRDRLELALYARQRFGPEWVAQPVAHSSDQPVER